MEQMVFEILQKFIPIIITVILLYAINLMAILTDLWSGIRKAKQNKIVRTSEGFRRTFNKVAKYFNVALIFTILDIAVTLSVWYFNTYCNTNIPYVPIFSICTTLGICATEIKSILEKADQKKIKYLGTLAGDILSDKRAKEVVKLLTEMKNEKDN